MQRLPANVCKYIPAMEKRMQETVKEKDWKALARVANDMLPSDTDLRHVDVVKLLLTRRYLAETPEPFLQLCSEVLQHRIEHAQDEDLNKDIPLLEMAIALQFILLTSNFTREFKPEEAEVVLALATDIDLECAEIFCIVLVVNPDHPQLFEAWFRTVADSLTRRPDMPDQVAQKFPVMMTRWKASLTKSFSHIDKLLPSKRMRVAELINSKITQLEFGLVNVAVALGIEIPEATLKRWKVYYDFRGASQLPTSAERAAALGEIEIIKRGKGAQDWGCNQCYNYYVTGMGDFHQDYNKSGSASASFKCCGE